MVACSSCPSLLPLIYTLLWIINDWIQMSLPQ
jgi:hypothetical protein